ncbi:interleukin-6 receptor subunit alpha isoform X2 [Pungitius pungitius]|uniref:interleukin-6 receptor subunit alpha isoform X2 n=1 Tax=Pungitius pungitius TaxID=134920 RepID=UPI002E131989
MRGFLPLLCVLCAARVRGIFDGTCPRKDPPPGVLVVPSGSRLLLTCSGHVEVDGVKVGVHGNSSNSRRGSPSSVNVTGGAAALTTGRRHGAKEPTWAAGGRGPGPTGAEHAASTAGPSPALKGRGDREAKEGDGASGYEEEEEGAEEGSRVTRGLKQWKWNGRTVGGEDRGWGPMDGTGASLSLSSVRPTDSGRYACYHRGRERFSLKVNVADPPESASLSCFKSSPRSKIRCEWAPKRPLAVSSTCYLFLSKSPTNAFHRLPCSYSARRSRCWCALDHNEDERRTVHVAYLCVTSMAGNATSAPLRFTPLDILKPGPPSGVTVRTEEGQETRMTVAWRLPKSWRPQGPFYELIYEIKYRPLESTLSHGQRQTTKERSCTIVDAMPGVEYLIEVRTKEEYDGQWSDWSTPVYASSRLLTTAKGPVESSEDGLSVPTFPVYTDVEGSSDTTDDGVFVAPEPVQSRGREVLHVMWISGSLCLLSVILVAYIMRHKDRFMPKLQRQRLVTQCADAARSPPPPTPTPAEGPAQVTFNPLILQSDVKEEVEEEENEEQPLKEPAEAVHLNNTSYFFLHSD